MKQTLSAIFLFLLLSGIISCKKNDILEKEIIEEIEEAKLDEKVDATLPHIYIDIENGQEVISKDKYLNASVEARKQHME